MTVNVHNMTNVVQYSLCWTTFVILCIQSVAKQGIITDCPICPISIYHIHTLHTVGHGLSYSV